MSSEPFFGNWMVAIAEAAEVAGASDLDTATTAQMVRAWDLVGEAADISPEELTRGIALQAHIPVADLDTADARASLVVPAEVAHRRNVLPLSISERLIGVATANPLSQGAKREIAALTGRAVSFEAAAPESLATKIEEVYGASSEHDAPSSEAPAPRQPGGPHVLVVDDEAGQRALFRSVLEESGYRVTVSKDGAAALELLRAGMEVDCVTLDYWMDKMNGLRVLQAIRADAAIRKTPVIMVTGAGDRQIEMSLFEAGADDYIAKPVDGPLFLLRVQAVLRRRRFR